MNALWAGMDTQKKDGERIAKRIARAGRASRREAERLIESGRVKLNGKTVQTPATLVVARDVILVDDVPLADITESRLWRYHKPVGLVTTERDEKGRKTVFDALPPELGRVLSVGRLDINSEGLLLLTNDGGLKRQLELPATGWLRKYRVRVRGRPDAAQLQPLIDGMVIDGERFQGMQVAIDRQQGANAWLTIALREGKNREIRRALKEVGMEVSRLIRVSYGPFQLLELRAGQVEEIRPKIIREQIGGDFSSVTSPRSAAPKDAADPSKRLTRPARARKGGKPPASGPKKGGRPATRPPKGRRD